MQIQTFLCIVDAWGLRSSMMGVYFALKRLFFCIFATPGYHAENVISKRWVTPPPHPSPSLLTTFLCFSFFIVFCFCVCVYFVCHLSQGCILMSDVCFLCICKIAFRLLWWSVDTGSSSNIKISSL